MYQLPITPAQVFTNYQLHMPRYLLIANYLTLIIKYIISEEMIRGYLTYLEDIVFLGWRT